MGSFTCQSNGDIHKTNFHISNQTLKADFLSAHETCFYWNVCVCFTCEWGMTGKVGMCCYILYQINLIFHILNGEI